MVENTPQRKYTLLWELGLKFKPNFLRCTRFVHFSQL